MSRSAVRSHFPYCFRRLNLELLEDRSLLSAGPTTVELGGVPVSQGSFSTTDVLVQFRAGTTPFALAGTTLGRSLAAGSEGAGMYEINLLPGTTVAQALNEYEGKPGVVAEQPDYSLTPSWIPNDPNFSQQWDMNNTGQQGGTPGADIGAAAAWGVTTGSGRMIVAVIDTGVDFTDSDLYDNIWINQAAIPASRLKNLVDVYHNGYISMRDLNSPINQGPGKIEDLNHNGYIDAGDLLQPMVLDAKGQDTGLGGWVNPNAVDSADGLVGDIVGWNFSANTDNPYDDVGHGTFVAGTIGATGNNGTGIAGINWNIQIMPLKIFNAQSQGTISSAIAAIDYATAHGAKISNNSWDGAGDNPLLEAAIAQAQAKGDIFVAAAGNSGVNSDQQPDYPADFPLSNIVSVAATDRYNHLASFSNYGATSVDIAAPGVDVYSTLPGNTYGTMSGTSMATPHVTGVLALVWDLRPEWTYSQVIAQVMNTVTKVPALAGKLAFGGIVNAAAAVKVPARPATPSIPNNNVKTASTKATTATLHTASVSDLPVVTTAAIGTSPASTSNLARPNVPYEPTAYLVEEEEQYVVAALGLTRSTIAVPLSNTDVGSNSAGGNTNGLFNLLAALFGDGNDGAGAA